MQLKQFIQQNRQNWQQLEEYIQLFGKNRTKPSHDMIETFDQLYQMATQNLSYSQTFFPDSDVTIHLNQLVSRAHNILYKTEHTSWAQLRTFFSEKFVGLLLEQWRPIIIALLLFALGGLASFVTVAQNPLQLEAILPGMISNVLSPEQLESNVQANQGSGVAALMSAAIMTNNIQVAILAFAGGITFGILTVYILVYNGIMVGALAGLFWHSSSSYVFWAYIVPHGIIELIAIFIAGGAGLLMGYKLFVPGNYKRSTQLKYHALRSIQLLLGTIPLFVLAGAIEGFITPAGLTLELKYVVAIITLIGFIVYMLWGHSRQLKRASI
ncbi:stage II sporulation protein M [Amphibacillus cookii]|uniref:stage II sporulation protein M n=1 Tax=Amphibacillus cookii TaxID=767787 RepID=UPI00195C9C20|nr:stage II sporulation protein M [Amphibacillus cookii]MBM7542086.1 putative membrane protein SpoIIM required for sporulation [Amphibacillus cookii]